MTHDEWMKRMKAAQDYLHANPTKGLSKNELKDLRKEILTLVKAAPSQKEKK